MWKNKWNKYKKCWDIRQYKPGMRKKNNTLVWFAAVYFSQFLYDDNIAYYWVFSSKMCLNLIFWSSETKI